MHKITFFILVIIMPLLMSVSSTASEDIEKEYCTAMMKHFEIDADSLAVLLEMDLDIQDLPVVLFLAGINKSGPSPIAKLRTGGESWMGIIKNRVISPSRFYFMLMGEIDSKTFAPIFAKYKALPERKWSEIILTDEEICDLVNLKFIYSYHDYSVFEVMKMRDAGDSYPEINHQVSLKKEEMFKEEKRKKKEASRETSDEGD